MSYTLPIFNVLYDFWTGGHLPSVHPVPDVSAVPGQIYIDSRRRVPWRESNNPNDYLPIILRLAVGTYFPVQNDIVREFPGGATTYWKIIYSWRIHRGFPNEYVQSLIADCFSNGQFVSMGPP